MKKRLEVVGNGIGSDLLDKGGVPKAGERVIGRGKQRELARALQSFDQPRAGNQSFENGVSCRIHHNVHDGGWLDGGLERGQGSKTAQRLGATQAEA